MKKKKKKNKKGQNRKKNKIKKSKHKINLVEDGISVLPTPWLYSPGGSSNLQLHVLDEASTHEISPFPVTGNVHLTQLVKSNFAKTSVLD